MLRAKLHLYNILFIQINEYVNDLADEHGLERSYFIL